MTDPAQERIAALEQRLAKEPQSPLFARLAAYYLHAGRSKDALRLCDDGLANYPYYATAHLIKGKVLANLGMMAEAKHEYEVVHELLPTNETVAKLYSSIELAGGPERTTAPAEKEIAEPKVAAVAPPPVAVEKPAVEKPPVAVAEEAPPQEPIAVETPVASAEEPPVQEVAAEEPPVAAQIEVAPAPEELSGFGETPIVEAVPEAQGAADKLGIEWKEEPQQTLSDYGFGSASEPPAAAATEEVPFGTQQTEEPPPVIEAAPEQAQEQAPAEQFEAEPAQASPEPASAETPVADANQNQDWFEAFSQLQQPAGEVAEAPLATPAEEENPFAMFETEQPSTPPAEGAAYEEYTARVRMELFGTEDTMTLEEYLGESASAEAPPQSPDNIGELAEKLKTSQRITPPVINFSEKAPRVAGDGGTPNGSGIVTPTLAEIYVKQGWYDDAIKAYRVLAANKPAEKEKYEQRIAEIEELKKKP